MKLSENRHRGHSKVRMSSPGLSCSIRLSHIMQPHSGQGGSFRSSTSRSIARLNRRNGACVECSNLNHGTSRLRQMEAAPSGWWSACWRRDPRWSRPGGKSPPDKRDRRKILTKLAKSNVTRLLGVKRTWRLASKCLLITQSAQGGPSSNSRKGRILLPIRIIERWRSAYETNALLAEFGIARPLPVRTSRRGADTLFAGCIDRLFRLDALDQWSHCTFHHNCRDFG
jgi:hypothetical protein